MSRTQKWVGFLTEWWVGSSKYTFMLLVYARKIHYHKSIPPWVPCKLRKTVVEKWCGLCLGRHKQRPQMLTSHKPRLSSLSASLDNINMLNGNAGIPTCNTRLVYTGTHIFSITEAWKTPTLCVHACVCTWVSTVYVHQFCTCTLPVCVPQYMHSVCACTVFVHARVRCDITCIAVYIVATDTHAPLSCIHLLQKQHLVCTHVYTFGTIRSIVLFNSHSHVWSKLCLIS